jgi:hypothetical protein
MTGSTASHATMTTTNFTTNMIRFIS